MRDTRRHGLHMGDCLSRGTGECSVLQGVGNHWMATLWRHGLLMNLNQSNGTAGTGVRTVTKAGAPPHTVNDALAN